MYQLSSMPAKLVWVAMALCFLAVQTTAASAQSKAIGVFDRYHAVLVGVSNYPDAVIDGVNEGKSATELKLDGPKHDVEFTYKMLVGLKRGTKVLYDPKDITVVADSLRPEFLAQLKKDKANLVENPTRANIRKSLDAVVNRLNANAGDNDFVYLHMSGHGVQAPARGTDLDIEPDGKDELFLPIDVGKWIPIPDLEDEFELENAITDNEIARYIGKLKKKAFVWLVFDSCHSGDMVRAASDAAKTRRVQSFAFGPKFAEALSKASARAAKTRSFSGASPEAPIGGETATAHGGKRFVAFYAVQSNQLAIEKKLPDAAAPPVGLFTYSLVKSIQALPNASYQQIAEATRVEYDRFGGQLRQPLFEGELGKMSFGGVDPDKSWTVKRDGWKMTMQAGELKSITEGSIVALYEFAKQDDPNALLGYAKVRRVNLTASELSPVAHKNVAAVNVVKLSNRMTAVMVAANIGLELRVAAPPAKDFDGVEASVKEMITKAFARADQPTPNQEAISLKQLPAGSHADIYLSYKDGRLCLLRQMGNCGSRVVNAKDPLKDRPAPGIAIGSDMTADQLAGRLYANFYRAAKVFKLLSLYQRSLVSSKKSDIFSRDKIDLKLTVVTYPHAKLRASQGEKHDCDRNFSQYSEGVNTINLKPAASTGNEKSGQSVDVVHCDRVEVRGRNAGDTPVDLTLLHIDSEFSITPLPTHSNVTVRIMPENEIGGTENYDSDPYALQFVTWCKQQWGISPCRNASRPWSTGAEYIIAIAVEQPKGLQSNYADFRNMQQSGIDHDAARTRGGGNAADASLCPEDSVAKEFCKIMRSFQTGIRGAIGMQRQTLSNVALQLYRLNVQPPVSVK